MAKVTGLDGIVAAETAISLVDGTLGQLVYRGYWAKELAIQYEYEQVAYLLCNGSLPNSAQQEQFANSLTANRHLPESIQSLLDIIPREMSIMDVLQAAIAMMSGGSFNWPPTLNQAIQLIAMMPTIVAYRYRKQHGWSVIEPNDALSHTANFLYMLTGKLPNPAHVKALDAYLILGMEHGMNASTFAARVVLSTQSDIASAVSAAIGAMKGPLHGGAPTEVIALLDAIGSKEHAEPWLRNALERGHRLMGFGHRIYKTRDPRAEALREVTAALSGNDPWFDLALDVEQKAVRLLQEYKPGRHLYANVEFFAASIMRAIALPTVLFTPTFTIARVVGWSAHILEQTDVNRIFRPQSVYTGAMPK